MWLKAVMAGMFISIGGAASSIAASTITNFGIAKAASALIFPIGLILIILVCGELFTGDCLMVNTIHDYSCTIKEIIPFLLFVWFGNLTGAGLFAAFLKVAGYYQMNSALVGAYAIQVAAAKCAISPLRGIVSGTFCNILVCLAVLLSGTTEEMLGKLAGIAIPIFTFVICGFEHSVADMYYLFAGIFANSIPDCAIAATGTIVYSGALKSLLWVTLGNIIGGVLIAFILYYMYI